jgi:hypothetical protein
MATIQIAMISPGISCVENTMNTLRYADRFILPNLTNIPALVGL